MILVHLDVRLDPEPDSPPVDPAEVRLSLLNAIEMLTVWSRPPADPAAVAYDVTVLAAREPLDAEAVMKLVHEYGDLRAARARSFASYAYRGNVPVLDATTNAEVDAAADEIRRLVTEEAADHG